MFVDLDGVLADFNAAYLALTGVAIDRVAEPDFEAMRAHGRFYEDLPLLPGAMDFWHRVGLLTPDGNPIILTGVPRSIPEAAAQKRRWVDRHLGQVGMFACRSREKALHGAPGDILIDDWSRYQKRWEATGGVFIHHKTQAASLAQLRAVLMPEAVTA